MWRPETCCRLVSNRFPTRPGIHCRRGISLRVRPVHITGDATRYRNLRKYSTLVAFDPSGRPCGITACRPRRICLDLSRTAANPAVTIPSRCPSCLGCPNWTRLWSTSTKFRCCRPCARSSSPAADLLAATTHRYSMQRTTHRTEQLVKSKWGPISGLNLILWTARNPDTSGFSDWSSKIMLQLNSKRWVCTQHVGLDLEE